VPEMPLIIFVAGALHCVSSFLSLHPAPLPVTSAASLLVARRFSSGRPRGSFSARPPSFSSGRSAWTSFFVGLLVLFWRCRDLCFGRRWGTFFLFQAGGFFLATRFFSAMGWTLLSIYLCSQINTTVASVVASVARSVVGSVV
jgi:hypothetical protein